MKERIDKLLLERGLARSRQQAQALILAGQVLADEQRIDKCGTRIDSDVPLRLKNPPPPYVSRAGIKLEKALQLFVPSIEGWVCLDIGASTGGFTDCLLQHGARKVFAVDVGHNQLDWSLRSDSRVTSIEGLNARYLKYEDIGSTVDLITVDVSFISLSLILPQLPPFLKPGSLLICLIKPQFEVGKGEVGKGGLVKEARLHQQVIDKIRKVAQNLGFEEMGLTESPISGAEGNKEFLIALTPGTFATGSSN
jgi:23S rRNA (cytidine1920-2'-O)/16S rRNA (cytidine1409-2'-O)-methyltransferase